MPKRPPPIRTRQMSASEFAHAYGPQLQALLRRDVDQIVLTIYGVPEVVVLRLTAPEET